MTKTGAGIDVYLETGKKRTFAGAVEWPGWCRSGRDEESAVQALLDCGPRYARMLQKVGMDLEPPQDATGFVVKERLEGNSTTDFGAPDMAPSTDSLPIGEGELERLQTLLKACWNAFDSAVQFSTGKELRLGPRGGGRSLERIIEHVVGAEGGYLSMLAWKIQKTPDQDLPAQLEGTHQASLAALEKAVRNGIPEKGPRGGTYWKPRYFVRRVAWHVLDHAWELEDRVLSD
jgi:hypothetical protein